MSQGLYPQVLGALLLHPWEPIEIIFNLYQSDTG